MYNGKAFKESVFIVWTPFTPRAHNLSEFLSCEIYFIKHLITNRGFFWKFLFLIDYMYKCSKTSVFLIRKKPKVVFAQSPPSFCPMICMLYCKIFNAKLVIDCHDSTFFTPWISIPFYKSVLSGAKAVIVHNNELGEFARKKFKRIPFVTLNDKLKHCAPLMNKCLKSIHEKYFLVILIFSNDEPAIELLEAIKQFLKTSECDYQFKITGDYSKSEGLFERYNDVKGIEFLGYIPRNDYNELLQNAFGAITLTTRDMKQGCAVAEAVGANIPLIASDTETNRNLLRRGAIFTSSDVTSIKHAIERFIKTQPMLSVGIKMTDSLWEDNWKQCYKQLISILNS